jgi:hypothetical protein
MLRDGDAVAGFERRERPARYNARHWHERVAARAQKMVVMRGDELKTSPSVVEQNFSDHTVGGELFSGAKNRRKIRRGSGARQVGMHLLERPSVALVAGHEVRDGAGDAGCSGHAGFHSRSRSVAQATAATTQIICVFICKSLA